MHVTITDAKALLTDLVRRAEVGEDTVLTRHGHPSVRLVPVRVVQTTSARRALLEEVRAAGRSKAAAGREAARSQDWLSDAEGLPM